MSFKLEERVLCFHGPLLYEAKVLKSKHEYVATEEEDGKEAGRIKEWSYLVHYKGWKRTWDEWVLEERLRKWNEDNLKYSKELKVAALAAQRKSTEAQGPKKPSASNKETSETTKDTASSTTARNNKRAREIEVEKDDLPKPKLYLALPDQLKARLVDDWEWITKDHRLVPLPRNPSVAEILTEYRLSVPMKRPGSAEADVFDEIMTGLQQYFEKCLGTILLYRFERQQYADIRKKYGDGLKLSEIYGAEHFLRLLVSMQDLVAQTLMDPQAVSVLRTELQHIVSYIVKNYSSLLVDEYEVTPASYSRAMQIQ